MCGRFSQREQSDIYAARLNWTGVSDVTEGPRYNVPPGTRPIVLHRLGDGSEQADRLFWGYIPPWPNYKRGPASNARLDTVLKDSKFWRPLLTKRIIVPVDGWYEWVGEKGDKQPWYIHAKDSEPILMAGITAWEPRLEMLAENGFAIITDDAAGGMVDIHDRRPIALNPNDAMEWLNPDRPADDALEILGSARPESAFEWWPVTRKVGNSKYQGEDSTVPLST